MLLSLHGNAFADACTVQLDLNLTTYIHTCCNYTTPHVLYCLFMYMCVHERLMTFCNKQSVYTLGVFSVVMCIIVCTSMRVCRCMHELFRIFYLRASRHAHWRTYIIVN